MFITASPQSTAEVERTFSGLNNNKNKLRDCLAVCTSEAIIKSSENFPGVFEVNQRGKNLGIYELHGEAKEIILKNQNSEAFGAITNETFSLLIATSWRVARDLCLDSLPKMLANLRRH